jgi:hypothetical protein
MTTRLWVIACLALGLLFGALAGIATVRANLNTHFADATPGASSNPKIAGRDIPTPVYPNEGADDESLSRELDPDVNDEDIGDDGWLEDNPFAPGG